MDERPTLTELMRFGKDHVNIIEDIGDKYHMFGTFLLDDKTGSKMGAIEGYNRGRAEAINITILTRWIGGEGRRPTSWGTLTTVLDQCKLCVMADEIRSAKAKPGTS